MWNRRAEPGFFLAVAEAFRQHPGMSEREVPRQRIGEANMEKALQRLLRGRSRAGSTRQMRCTSVRPVRKKSPPCGFLRPSRFVACSLGNRRSIVCARTFDWQGWTGHKQ